MPSEIVIRSGLLCSVPHPTATDERLALLALAPPLRPSLFERHMPTLELPTLTSRPTSRYFAPSFPPGKYRAVWESFADHLFKCHGTGTQAGDPTEVQGVGSVFAATRRTDKPLIIGSVSSLATEIQQQENQKSMRTLSELQIPTDARIIDQKQHWPFRAGSRYLRTFKGHFIHRKRCYPGKSDVYQSQSKKYVQLEGKPFLCYKKS